MKAQETSLKPLLEGKRQYQVPLYQRRYTWTSKEWTPFWNAVQRQYELLSEDPAGGGLAGHFLGSFVVKPTTEHAHVVSTFQVIDGQQRLATIIALLAVIRDLSQDTSTSESIHESYLVNKFETGDLFPRLRMGRHDDADMSAIIGRRPDEASGSIGAMYRWLKNKVLVLEAERGGLDLRLLEQTVALRLEVVDITASIGDNAHRIFQTLNSTGLGLSQVDLLRNHFFMLLPTLANVAYEQTWLPMEELLGDRLNPFLWVELVSRGGGRETVARDLVYDRWRSDLEAVEHDEREVRHRLELLGRRAHSYRRVLYPEEVEADALRVILGRLKQWETSVHHPVTLQVVSLVDDGELSTSEAAEALLYVESFLVRRLLAGIPTNNLNRIFTTVAGQMIAADAYAEQLRATLSGPGKYWPTDAEIVATVPTADFYHAQRPVQRRFVLQRLEEALPGPEQPDWSACSYTLEHVMPQNLNPAWQEVLEATGEQDAMAAHTELVHTLGNLTLTCQNPSLSDLPLERKQEIFEQSMLKLNRQFLDVSKWSRSEIVERSGRLCDLAITIWPGPVDVEDLDRGEDWSLVSSALSVLPPGHWTSVDDLAELADSTPDRVIAYLSTAGPIEGRYLVLNADGSFQTAFSWVTDAIENYRQRLLEVGVLQDMHATRASVDRRLTGENLESLLAS